MNTTLIERQKILGWNDDPPGQVFQNIEFNKCSFTGCYLNYSDDPSQRTTVSNIKILNCEQKNSIIGSAIIEDSFIENLKCRSLLQTWGTIFKHIKLSKKIGRLMISPYIRATTSPKNIQHEFDTHRINFYKEVDWALDIRDAEFIECEIHGIPSALILRDPETQVIVNREILARSNYRDLNYSNTHILSALNIFLDSYQDDDLVLIAPRLDKNYREFKGVLDSLVNSGIASR